MIIKRTLIGALVGFFAVAALPAQTILDVHMELFIDCYADFGLPGSGSLDFTAVASSEVELIDFHDIGSTHAVESKLVDCASGFVDDRSVASVTPVSIGQVLSAYAFGSGYPMGVDKHGIARGRAGTLGSGVDVGPCLSEYCL